MHFYVIKKRILIAQAYIHINKSKISNLTSDIDKQFAKIRSNLGMGWDTSARREVFANTVDERSATEPELKYIVRNNII